MIGVKRKANLMSTKYYHTPPPPPSTRVRCPVCHQEVYSRAGIHPQCAVRQADPPRLKSKAKTLVDSGDPIAEPIVSATVDAVVEPLIIT